MALTQQQWYERLRTWVPTWVFETEDTNVAIFQSIALLLSLQQLSAEEFKAQTYLGTATGIWLDLHGAERGVTRLAGELDDQYRIRIRKASTISQLSVPSIKEIVDSFLIMGQATIREDFEGAVFCDRDEYANRGSLLLEPITNAFTIFVDKQVRPPESFADRESFSDRLSFTGSDVSSDYIFELIVKAVNENKALGVLYRIIERFE